jgi:hypothetical protein
MVDMGDAFVLINVVFCCCLLLLLLLCLLIDSVVVFVDWVCVVFWPVLRSYT